MGNGQPQTDREFLIQIAADQKTCIARLDKIDKKLDNHGQRISQTEKDVITNAGAGKLQDEKIEALEKKPSPSKAIYISAGVIGLLIAIFEFVQAVVK